MKFSKTDFGKIVVVVCCLFLFGAVFANNSGGSSGPPAVFVQNGSSIDLLSSEVSGVRDYDGTNSFTFGTGGTPTGTVEFNDLIADNITAVVSLITGLTTDDSVIFTSGGNGTMTIDADFKWLDSLKTLALGGTDTTTVLSLPSSNDAVTPTLAFGDGDTGLYENADDNVSLVAGGEEVARFVKSGATSTDGLYLADGVLFFDNNINGREKLHVTGNLSGIDSQGSFEFFGGANNIAAFSNVGAAVNSFDFHNSITGEALVIEATGDDTDIDIAMTPKGTGGVGVGTVVPVSTFEVDGSMGRDVTTLNAATLTLDATHDFVCVTYTATGGVTITLPSATSSWNSTDGIGRSYEISDCGANASVNNIDINRAGADTIITTATGQTTTAIVLDGGTAKLTAISASAWKLH